MEAFMEYELKVNQEWLWIGLPEELDHCQAELIRRDVKEHMQNCYIKYVVFDFQHTVFMDSSGIGLITGRYRELASRGGQVYVSHVSEHMKRVLTLSGLYRIVVPWEQVITETSIF
jgi:stage II sporulation protein AA (anti-sigma F factor antagonist)